jgi:pectate lyase
MAEWRNTSDAAGDAQGKGADWSRETLGSGDGWASAHGSTQGGADAALEHVYTVRNRAELVAALVPGVHPPRGAGDGTY